MEIYHWRQIPAPNPAACFTYLHIYVDNHKNPVFIWLSLYKNLMLKKDEGDLSPNIFELLWYLGWKQTEKYGSILVFFIMSRLRILYRTAPARFEGIMAVSCWKEKTISDRQEAKKYI